MDALAYNDHRHTAHEASLEDWMLAHEMNTLRLDVVMVWMWLIADAGNYFEYDYTF